MDGCHLAEEIVRIGYCATTNHVFRALNLKLDILSCFLSEDLLAIHKFNELIEGLNACRLKLQMLMAAKSCHVLTEILFTIDQRFNDWLQECLMDSSNIIKIDHDMIEFEDLIQEIKHKKKFVNALPPAFRQMESLPEVASSPLSSGPSLKNQRTESHQEENSKPIEAWKLLAGEELSLFSAPCVCNHPSGICFRWEMRQFCFSDCKQSKHHVNNHLEPKHPVMCQFIDKVRNPK